MSLPVGLSAYRIAVGPLDLMAGLAALAPDHYQSELPLGGGAAAQSWLLRTCRSRVFAADG